MRPSAASARTMSRPRWSRTKAGGRRSTVSCRFVLDCSGRAGVIGQHHRRPEPRHRLYGMVGVWRLSEQTAGWGLADETHTLVETYEDGWAWSVPISPSTRHVGTMVDGTSPRVTAGRALRDAYEAEIRKTERLAPVLEAATLQHVFACDASLYPPTFTAGRVSCSSATPARLSIRFLPSV